MIVKVKSKSWCPKNKLEKVGYFGRVSQLKRVLYLLSESYCFDRDDGCYTNGFC